jgi:hypothetical protein
MLLPFLSQSCYFFSKLRKYLCWALQHSHLMFLYPNFLAFLCPLCLDFPMVFIGFQARILMDSIKDWSSFINTWPLIEMGWFWTNLNSWKLFSLFVLQWWFCNKLKDDFFAKLRGQCEFFWLSNLKIRVLNS